MIKRGSVKVFCQGELTTARHVSGAWWRCECGQLVHLLEPVFNLTKDQELARLIVTQNTGGLSSLSYFAVPIDERKM